MRHALLSLFFTLGIVAVIAFPSPALPRVDDPFANPRPDPTANPFADLPDAPPSPRPTSQSSSTADADPILQGFNSAKTGAEVTGVADVRSVTSKIIKTFLALIGIIAVVILINGGYKYMTSGGNEEDTKKAKGLISAAVIGLIIVLIAYSITRYVFDSLLLATGSL